MPVYHEPSARGSPRRSGKVNLVLISSYVFDWVVIIVAAAVGFVLGDIDPNKRPFSLEDPDISFPFTTDETVPTWLLFVCVLAIPAVLVLVIALVFVPGPTVPRGTPASLVWKRRLWEWHAGWLGLGLSLASAWFITSGMKNLFGKPRPDMLARCHPDLAAVARYVVGGVANVSSNGQLVSAAICRNPDASTLQDGFRSFPSGHSSSAAAGLLYLSLFIASKFAITFPFLAPAGYADQSAFSAFPSRVPTAYRDDYDRDDGGYELADRAVHDEEGLSASHSDNPSAAKRLASHRASVSAARRQAAAPPLYLLAAALCPFFAAIFIASSRWFDFRHHGFDILFGFGIGCVCAVFAFRFYHLPVSQGAGWAWGPRSADKAWWAGVGSFSYATDRERYGRLSSSGGGGGGGNGEVADEEDAIEGRGGGARRVLSPDGGNGSAKRERTGQSTGASV
ncbi:Pap2 domain containing protein [Pleurostoma richardsiae]|uniref:Pap2 domain containing protein n=1 Tax=Pleurostoma richardsiae TaxID=41990 RepID=A0AA38VQJ2_9PEZI|nr:Pap2 domain containing protein [Pleurostoma richardsiae]